MIAIPFKYISGTLKNCLQQVVDSNMSLAFMITESPFSGGEMSEEAKNIKGMTYDKGVFIYQNPA